MLVSALNEDLDRVSVRYAALVFRESFLKSAEAGRMGVPAVPLSQLYGTAAAYIEARGGKVHLRAPVDSIRADGDGGVSCASAAKRCAPITPCWRRHSMAWRSCCRMSPELEAAARRRTQLCDARRSPEFIYGSIARSRRWNMRCCWSAPSSGCFTSRRSWPRAGIRRREGSYLELVVSSSKTLVDKPRAEIIDLAVRELAEFFPAVREAKLTKATVIKEVHATFSPAPGSDAFRPSHTSSVAATISGRRLDGDRLARHHGRRGAQRLRSRRGAERGQVPGAGSAGEGIDAAFLNGLLKFEQDRCRITPAKRGSWSESVRTEHDRYFAQP